MKIISITFFKDGKLVSFPISFGVLSYCNKNYSTVHKQLQYLMSICKYYEFYIDSCLVFYRFNRSALVTDHSYSVTYTFINKKNN